MEMQDLNEILMPKYVENLYLPSPELVSYYSDLDNRIYWINEEIEPNLLELSKLILKWNREDKNIPIDERKPIRLMFFSPGGDLDVAFTTIDFITASETPVIGINVGQCCSAAAMIFLSCHKRYMMKHSYFLLHRGSGSFVGNFDQIVSQVNDYQDAIDDMIANIKERTNYSDEEVEEKVATDWIIRYKEALEKGLVDGVVNQARGF